MKVQVNRIIILLIFVIGARVMLSFAPSIVGASSPGVAIDQSLVVGRFLWLYSIEFHARGYTKVAPFKVVGSMVDQNG